MTLLITLMVLGAAALIPASACYFCRTCKLARCGNAFAPEVTRKHQIIVQTGNVVTLAVALVGLELLHGWQLVGLFFALLIAFGVGEIIGLYRARQDETKYDTACASLYEGHMQARSLMFTDFETRTAGLSDAEREEARQQFCRTDQTAWETHESARRRLYRAIFRR